MDVKCSYADYFFFFYCCLFNIFMGFPLWKNVVVLSFACLFYSFLIQSFIAHGVKFSFSTLGRFILFFFFEISLTAALILKDWIVITLFCTCCFIGGYGVQDLCKWFNFFHIHYRVKFSDHALCFIQFLRVVSFQAPTVQCPIEKNRTGCFWFSISRDKNFPSIHLPGQKKRCVSIK